MPQDKLAKLLTELKDLAETLATPCKFYSDDSDNDRAVESGKEYAADSILELIKSYE